MSSKIDLTSLAFIIPIMDNGVKKYVIFSHSFIPSREKLMERTLKDKVPYDAWERIKDEYGKSKYITITNTPIVDQNVVIKYAIDFVKDIIGKLIHGVLTLLMLRR